LVFFGGTEGGNWKLEEEGFVKLLSSLPKNDFVFWFAGGEKSHHL
jgi:hypothetical protein